MLSSRDSILAEFPGKRFRKGKPCHAPRYRALVPEIGSDRSRFEGPINWSITSNRSFCWKKTTYQYHINKQNTTHVQSVVLSSSAQGSKCANKFPINGGMKLAVASMRANANLVCFGQHSIPNNPEHVHRLQTHQNHPRNLWKHLNIVLGNHTRIIREPLSDVPQRQHNIMYLHNRQIFHLPSLFSKQLRIHRQVTQKRFDQRQHQARLMIRCFGRQASQNASGRVESRNWCHERIHQEHQFRVLRVLAFQWLRGKGRVCWGLRVFFDK